MPKASMFSATCSRLSQYLKQNGGVMIPDLTIQPPTPTITLDLFPTTVGLNSPAKNTDKEKLTIFYSGKMIVLDDIPADKAMELMNMAGRDGDYSTVDASPAPTAPATAVDLERLRRPQSLRRFLEKRRERMTPKAPYQVDASRKTTLMKEVVAQSWLGLGQQDLISELETRDSRS